MEPTFQRFQDFAPALRLLPAGDRRRALALARYTREIFALAQGADAPDASRERFAAAVDRWRSDLVTHLAEGDADNPRAPEVIRHLAAFHRQRPWSFTALDQLVSAAEQRALQPRPATPEAAEAAADHLGRALAGAMLGWPVAEALARFVGALGRLVQLQHLGAELAAGRCPLAVSDLPEGARRPDLRAVVRTVRLECARLRPALLGVAPGLLALTRPYQRAAAYLLLAALALLTHIENADSLFLDHPPRLSTWQRRMLLARARFQGLRALG